MSNALNSGFRRSLWGILGQQAALLAHIVIVALGVGVLVADVDAHLQPEQPMPHRK